MKKLGLLAADNLEAVDLEGWREGGTYFESLLPHDGGGGGGIVDIDPAPIYTPEVLTPVYDPVPLPIDIVPMEPVYDPVPIPIDIRPIEPVYDYPIEQTPIDLHPYFDPGTLYPADTTPISPDSGGGIVNIDPAPIYTPDDITPDVSTDYIPESCIDCSSNTTPVDGGNIQTMDNETTTTAPTTEGGGIVTWIKENPLLVAGAAFSLFFLLSKKKKRA